MPVHLLLGDRVDAGIDSKVCVWDTRIPPLCGGSDKAADRQADQPRDADNEEVF
jgi:hypothetical protein